MRFHLPASLVICTVLMHTVPAHAEKFTVDDRIDQIKDAVETRLKPRFAKADAPFPPKRIVLYGLKKEERLQVFAPDKSGRLKFIYQYEIAAATTTPGPKLREGDLQTPEGIYKVTFLNPNSSFWLGMEINYPNAFDKKMGARDKRKSLGSAIAIHGYWVSEGCLAMGNTAIEDLFYLAAKAGQTNVKVIIAPHDLRNDPDTATIEKENKSIKWLPELYDDLRDEVNALEHTGADHELALVSYPDIRPAPREGILVTLLKMLLAAPTPDIETSSTTDLTSGTEQKETAQ